ncbi:vWA domain-containing protein [Mycobacterium sp. HUMS_1102779]|uniref:vWA domain-containing protein n=1 Tax=Mycobacterium sp. HUMS_1102779 TaxID=3383487 RepID=UPI00389A0FB6
MGGPALLRGVDLAAFAAALVARLRGAGVHVSADGPASFVQALRLLGTRTGSALYWAARLTLVNRADDLGAFDAVFAAVFGAGETGRSTSWVAAQQLAKRASGPVRGAETQSGVAAGLPWATRAAAGRDDDDPGAARVAVPDVLPSRIAARADEPFDRFDARDLRLLGDWIEETVVRWPRRRSMRFEPSAAGKRIDLRATMNASRKTGFEALTLARTRPRRRPRRVVLVCDVSRSMRPYAAMYLHLMRALTKGRGVRRAGIRPEVFAFSTSLTRLTAVLSHRSAEVALQRAEATVTDRYGGTSVGRSLATLLAPGLPGHGNALRGAVVIVASDGWDGDPPDVLARAMARLRRRAAVVAWVNPRAAQAGFEPLTGSMAAALPYCDLFLPAHSLTGLRQLLLALCL